MVRYVNISSVFYEWQVQEWNCVHCLYIFRLYVTCDKKRRGFGFNICTHYVCILRVVGRGVELCIICTNFVCILRVVR